MIHDFISACVYGLAIRLNLGPEHNTIARLNRATNFVHAQIGRMPRMISAALRTVILLSIIACVIRYRRTPSGLRPPARANFLKDLERSRLGPFRDLSRLLGSFTVMSLFSLDQDQP